MGNFKVVLGVFVIALFVGRIDAANCPRGYEYELGGKCYAIIYQRFPYEDAERMCMDYGANLVVPRSPEELTFLQDIMFSKNVGLIWTGCNDRDEEGTYMCLDDAPLDGRWAWTLGEPDNGQGKCHHVEEDCTIMRLNGKLWDCDCKQTAYVICEL